MQKVNSSLPLSEQMAEADYLEAQNTIGRRFSLGSRPVIRWIKGDGLDDQVTKAAIGQATRLFGSAVDYCLCTNGIDAQRVHNILEWADQPVEWYPVTSSDNQTLAKILDASGCQPEQYGYWWKWFPERVRPNAPEWILDGDIVITAAPEWFDDWVRGEDVVRVSQDDASPKENIYGDYSAYVDQDLMLYSGLISLPPKVTFMNEFADVMKAQPLKNGHDGRRDMCEQGVVALAFQKLSAKPIPLYEFPFGRAFEENIDFGKEGNVGSIWGYHFGNAFRMHNPHFERLTAEGIIFSQQNTSLIERFRWLGNFGQWGIPGWAMPDGCTQIICDQAWAFVGKRVLELGTSRGRISAMLATIGCRVTTVDHQDRGAFQNLGGLSVKVVCQDAIDFLETTNENYDFIIVDLHGNTPENWRKLKEPLLSSIKSGGLIAIDNVVLYEIPEWREETGVKWFLDQLSTEWKVDLHTNCLPGIALVKSNKHFSDPRLSQRTPLLTTTDTQRGDEQQLIVVLGMHRSGTSTITRALQILGVKLGNHLMLPVAGVNDKGFFEDLDIVALNEEILNACEKCWHGIEPIPSVDIDYLCDRGYLFRAIELLRNKLSPNNIFAFKDPRTSKLMPFWSRVFTVGGFDVRFVLAMRNPLSVVRSLEKRDGFHAEHAYLLWVSHVLTSLCFLQNQNVIAVDYDQFLDDPEEEINRLSSWLGMSIDQDALVKYRQDFLEKSLRHSKFLPDDVFVDTAALDLAKDIYSFFIEVQAHRVSIEHALESGKLKQWTEEFDRLRPILRLSDKQHNQIMNLSQAVIERDGQISNLSQAVIERDGQIVNLAQAAVDARRELAQVMESKSWRITEPLRFLRRAALSWPYVATRLGLFHYIRVLWRALPISNEIKRSLKKFIFKT